MPDANNAVPAGADAYELTMPEGHTRDAQVVDGWKATFHQAGLTQEQAQRVVEWHTRLAGIADQHQRERDLLAPHELEAQTARHRELTAKKLTGHATPDELTEMWQLASQLVEARARA